MIAFNFTVNRSFLSYPSHPITVPKTQVDYPRLEAEGLRGDVVVVEPGGRRLPGRVYRSVAGYGEYYQIRTTGSRTDPLYSLRPGTELRVEMRRDLGVPHVYLRPRPSARTAAPSGMTTTVLKTAAVAARPPNA